MPALTEPPGLLMYRKMSRSGSSAASNSNWPQIALAIGSSTAVPMKMIRSLRSRLKTWSSSPMPGLPVRAVAGAGVATPSVGTTRAEVSFCVTGPASSIVGLSLADPSPLSAPTPLLESRFRSRRRRRGTSVLVQVVHLAVPVHVVAAPVVVDLDVLAEPPGTAGHVVAQRVEIDLV